MLKIEVDGGNAIIKLEIIAKNILPSRILEPIGETLLVTKQNRLKSQSDADSNKHSN